MPLKRLPKGRKPSSHFFHSFRSTSSSENGKEEGDDGSKNLEPVKGIGVAAQRCRLGYCCLGVIYGPNMPLALSSLPLLRRCDNAVVFVEGGVPLFHERLLSHRADSARRKEGALLKKSLRSAFCCGRRRSCYADLRRSACINVADVRILKGRGK